MKLTRENDHVLGDKILHYYLKQFYYFVKVSFCDYFARYKCVFTLFFLEGGGIIDSHFSVKMIDGEQWQQEKKKKLWTHFTSWGIQSQARFKTFSITGKVTVQRDARPQTGLVPGRRSENQLQLCDKGTATSAVCGELCRHSPTGSVEEL